MIDLNDYENAHHYKGDYAADLKALQKRLEHILVAHIVHDRPAVVMLEGWDAAGKGGIIERLTQRWDQRRYEVFPIAAPNDEEKRHDFLWRFRTRLPQPGNIAVFDRSWYGRVLVERVEGYATEVEWRRAYDEINAFEATLVEGGTTLVKLFVHVSQKQQDKRLKARLDDPWKRWKTGPDDYRNRARRTEYLAAMHDMFARTDTGGAPWTVIAGDDKKSGRIAALTAIADQLEAHVDMTPPSLDPELERVARTALRLD
ncbi:MULTISPECIES: polyphosphate kinase 2 family protein [unclassified Sphingomonas]|jgi:AMP-polyphosphate phosphotransferase|uniref:polyphosphate kinase 2 family protein n=1 Tax=unclassified Sphingomonas TaxID=196159 RepID=UPI000E10066D|nr:MULTISPECIES: polyphosphate kinase [unclassified Sphingomonas]AXJ96542.1 polyphosphate kinase [Sphingomonas sp. FARSPH]